jgi:hypothetical protein
MPTGDALSALFPFQVALVDLLAADAALGALVGDGADARIYASPAPSEPRLPYITMDQGTETSAGAVTFDKWGNVASLQLDIWTDSTQYRNSQGLALYGHIKRILQGKQFDIDGHRVVSCRVELLIDMPDPDGKTQHTAVLVRPRMQQA